MTQPLADWPVWRVPDEWQRIDVLSDLHLERARPRTLDAFVARVEESARQADALLILGDLFEAWVGDDMLDDPADDTARRVAQALRAASAHAVIALMHGNRDFLIGARCARACGARLLADPTVLDLGEARWLLTHGDALCLADTDYQAFRRQVRDPAWQHSLLAQPLARRLALAAQMRDRSEAGKRQRPLAEMDVDRDAAATWLRRAHATTLLHGHTHQPQDEDWDDGLGRVVLSDWELDHPPLRAELLTLERRAAGWQHRRIDLRPAINGHPA